MAWRCTVNIIIITMETSKKTKYITFKQSLYCDGLEEEKDDKDDDENDNEFTNLNEFEGRVI
jgi:hypothetical protein